MTQYFARVFDFAQPCKLISSPERIFQSLLSDVNYVEFCITHESVNPWRPFHIPPFITLNGGKKRQFMDKLGNLVNPFSQISSLSFDAAAIGKKGFKMENPSVWPLSLPPFAFQSVFGFVHH